MSSFGSFGSFGAPLDQVWGDASSMSASYSKKRSKKSCEEGLDTVMNMHSCSGKPPRPKSKPKKCPPAPPSSPRCPRPRKTEQLNGPPQWVPIETPPCIPRADMEHYEEASWGSAYNDSVTPFGFWNSEGIPVKKTFEMPSSDKMPPSDEYPAFLSSIPQFESEAPKSLNAENSDFDDEDFEEDEDEDDEGSPVVTPQTAIVAPSQKLDGAAFAAEMTVYVVSGILLIVVMEQFIQIGLRMQG